MPGSSLGYAWVSSWGYASQNIFSETPIGDTGKTKGSVDELKRHQLHTKQPVVGNLTKEVAAVFSCLVMDESTSIYPLHPSTAGSPC